MTEIPELRIDSKQQFIFLASCGATVPNTFTYRGRPFRIVKREAATELVEWPPSRPCCWTGLIQTAGLKSRVAKELTEAYETVRNFRAHADAPQAMPVDLGGRELEDIVRSDVSLAGCIIKHTQLHDADLSGTDFRGARFEHCNLNRVRLSKSNIEGCQFTDCTFDEVSLTRVSAKGVRFERCNLREMYLTAGEECWLSSASFEAC